MTAHEIITELDKLMRHYIDWQVDGEANPGQSADPVLSKRKAETCEKARNLMAETFGEPE